MFYSTEGGKGTAWGPFMLYFFFSFYVVPDGSWKRYTMGAFYVGPDGRWKRYNMEAFYVVPDGTCKQDSRDCRLVGFAELRIRWNDFESDFDDLDADFDDSDV